MHIIFGVVNTLQRFHYCLLRISIICVFKMDPSVKVENVCLYVRRSLKCQYYNKPTIKGTKVKHCEDGSSAPHPICFFSCALVASTLYRVHSGRISTKRRILSLLQIFRNARFELNCIDKFGIDPVVN